MKFILLTIFLFSLTNNVNSQASFILDARENTVKSVVETVKQLSQDDLKKQSLAEFKSDLSQKLITTIDNNNKEILSKEYEVISYINNVGMSIKDIYKPASCLMTLSTPSLLQSALETECTSFKSRTLEIIVLRWKEILIEYKDLKRYDGMVSENREIIELNGDVNEIIKKIESLSLLMDIQSSEKNVNFDETNQLKKYLGNTLKSAEDFIKLNNLIEIFLTRINTRFKETEISLKSN